MTRRRFAPALAAFALALAGLAGTAAEAAVQVRIQSPAPDQPVFGPTQIVVGVAANEAIDRVEVLVDGKLVGTLRTPPYSMTFDAGDQNVERRFRAVVYGASGASAADTLMTKPVSIDDQMSVELQQLYATVLRDRMRALDLEQDDFRVFDNGVEQTVVAFDRGELPLAAVLLLDTSESMQGQRLEAARRGAAAFVAGMRPIDQASIALFSDDLLRVTPFTPDKEVLGQALQGVEPVGGSAVNDFLYMSLKLLESRQGRRVVVLLSDGSDVHSVLPMSEVLWKARSSQALIYWIQLRETAKRKSFSSAWRDFKANDREFELLQKTVEESGGRIATIERIEDLEEAFRAILQELREQYALGYYSTSNRNDGTWHKVDVRVRKSGTRVRTRDGYIDY